MPLHIWGACGVGKPQIIAQVAADRNLVAIAEKDRETSDARYPLDERIGDTMRPIEA